MTTGAERPESEAFLSGLTSEQETLLKGIDLGTLLEQGRVSKVTLGLLLRTHLSENATTARLFALARLKRATDGLSLSEEDYERAGLTCAALVGPIQTFQIWLTHFATTTGYLIATGVHPLAWSSYQTTLAGILSKSDLRVAYDGADFTTKQERARVLTRWALGVGKFNTGMPLETIWQRLWRAETILRNGFPLTSNDGTKIEQLPLPGMPPPPRILPP